MPAPTALLRKAKELAEASSVPQPQEDNDEEFILDASNLPAEPIVPAADADGEMEIDEEGVPKFAPAKDLSTAEKISARKIPMPPNRMKSLKNQWLKIAEPLVEHLKLQVRMNIARKCVELRTSKHTTSTGALQMGEDFIKAIALGFEVDDAIALVRLEDLYILTFEIKDVKSLQGEHLSRAIARIAGKDGKTKHAIENSTRTRVVLAGQTVHILGGFKNIHQAKTAIIDLIRGAPPGKVYGNLKIMASRMKERF